MSLLTVSGLFEGAALTTFEGGMSVHLESLLDNSEGELLSSLMHLAFTVV